MSLRIASMAALLLSTAACSGSHEAGPTMAEREDLVETTAVVQTVDPETRQILLTREDGVSQTMIAGDEVRNLDQLEAGDRITLSFYEGVTVAMADPADPGDRVGISVAERAALGEKPGAAAGSATSSVVEFVSYDPATAIATYLTPEGVPESIVVAPEMRDFATAREPGDRILVELVRAIAVTVQEI